MSCKAACPVCLKPHSLDDNQAASVMRCDCGSMLFISPKGRLVATLQQDTPPQPADAAEETPPEQPIDPFAALDLAAKAASAKASPAKNKSSNSKSEKENSTKNKSAADKSGTKPKASDDAKSPVKLPG
ncbi:hypothetical protein RMSM_02825 [Rhodopirellula maiorica SM1]|uniref:Uncharacterized protein n=1 Tax=Rhodopirellula maiorica SM1 TaxID=1265738 RepID=M5S247_9BACT|nr:hypothetical protein [Rhodopirellula maiorica]EMI20249.1 hypothetical protein RMSM_02825 [Rhodopirellula maiorica SM1]